MGRAIIYGHFTTFCVRVLVYGHVFDFFLVAFSPEVALSVPKPPIFILKATLLEALRRKDAWVLGILMIVFAVVAVGARISGSQTLADGTFMLNLGLSLSVIFSHLLTVLLASRQLPDEIDNRTLYPLLARPLSRSGLLLGKWLACGISGLVVLVVFHLLTWLVTPQAEEMYFVMGIQSFVLLPLSLLWASALALLISLCLPRAAALFLSLVLVLTGENMASMLVDLPVMKHLLPRLGVLNLTTRLTDGIGTLPALDFISMLIYPFLWIVLCLAAAMYFFERKAL